MIIQKLLDDHELEFDKYTDKCCISKTELSEMMKEYAKTMCQKQKEICAEEALWDDEGSLQEGTIIYIDKDSILNSPFPEELQDGKD